MGESANLSEALGGVNVGFQGDRFSNHGSSVMQQTVVNLNEADERPINATGKYDIGDFD